MLAPRVHERMRYGVQMQSLLQIQELFLCDFCQVCHSWLISLSHFNKMVKVLLSLKILWLLGTICMETITDLAWATPKQRLCNAGCIITHGATLSMNTGLIQLSLRSLIY